MKLITTLQISFIVILIVSFIFALSYAHPQTYKVTVRHVDGTVEHFTAYRIPSSWGGMTSIDLSPTWRTHYINISGDVTWEQSQ